jgi:transcriptional regulator with XRE-family HTH domain
MTRQQDTALAIGFGENLARIRWGRRISQQRLAQAAGLSRDTIGKLESGKRLPGLDTVLVICQVLEIDPNELLAGLEAENTSNLPLPTRHTDLRRN